MVVFAVYLIHYRPKPRTRFLSYVLTTYFSPINFFKSFLMTARAGEAQMRALAELKILRAGLERFRPILVKKLSYSWDDLRSYASRTALLIKMINNKMPDRNAKAILKADFPTKKEEISRIAKKLRDIPDRERWFIDLDELVNFPKVLKNWHDLFFLEELA